MQKFIDYLKNKTGIDFSFYRANFIERRLIYRMFLLNLTDINTYLDYISKNPTEIELFLEKFTINTSFFFRDRRVFETLGVLILESVKARKNQFSDTQISHPTETHANEIFYLKNLKSEIPLKELRTVLQHLSIAKKITTLKHQPIKIWSCPCAAGQEPYSLVMLFDLLSKNIPNLPAYRIVASDIDKAALDKAKEGIYFEAVLKELPELFKAKYFTKIKNPLVNQYKISDEIKKKVEFIQEDIITGKHKKSTKYDIIFCRYFLIYIRPELQIKILRTLQSYLTPGGMIILGNPETIFHMRINLQAIDKRNPIYSIV